MKTILQAILCVCALTAGASADPGHKHGTENAWGVPGDPKKPARVIQITMREADGKMLFVPDRIEIRRGEQVRFVLRNNGEIVWRFTKAGTFDYSCLIPGHREAGMTGTIIVK